MIALPGVAIQSKIYESSASVVYRGIRVQDNRSLIVKMLKLDYPSTQELTRYKQEYEITCSLNLQGVIKAYSQQEYQRTLVILLEDFGGESLEQWMHKCPETFSPMPLSTFLRLAIDLTDILGRIHAANVIHKDINPGNIVLNLHTGVVKIIDFGIATRFNRTNPTFKSHYALEGTLPYLSPEQTGRMNRLLDYRTDFYSLGVTFYELLTGQLPFPTTDILELVHCHIAKQPPPPHELNATIPKAVSNIIMKLMAKNAEDRYQSAWGIKADLEICAEQLIEIGKIDKIQLGLQDIRDRFQIPQKLYGRDKEVAMLIATFERVAASPNYVENISEREQNSNSTFPVEMMLVSGYAGIGKSALVQEIYKPITQKRGYFISGKFDQFQRNIPYSAIADALQKLIQQLLGESDEQVQQWRSRLLTALGNNGQIIIDVIPEVELIIGKQPPAPEVGTTEAQNRFNRIFQSFVRVFCSKEHPLVIFLDDLQWIDSATLKLIELMLLDEQIQSLFLIGAYRDNEVNSTHPLVLMLERLQKQGVVFQKIILTPLTLEPLSQLIAETLHHNPDNVHSLAELVLRKTEGNPFFVNEFLRMLYSENLLTFDTEDLSWQWNIARIQAQNITDNVVELMLVKLKKLPESTQQILRLAACIGAEFDLDVLSIVCEQSPQLVFSDLLAAIQNGLIQPRSELDENLLIKEHKFLHDRVQQAAYTLIDEAHKQVVHLQIGQNLLTKTLPEQLSERIFEIVDHLNHGIELITEQSERNEIARLNLIAGEKAKAAIAYNVAKKYLATARVWLAASSWQTNYDLTLDLYTETTEIAYLCGDFEDVEHWLSIVLQKAKTVLDTVKVYEVKIQTYVAQEQLSKAINTGLQVLPQLGITIPKTPSQSDIQLELDAIASLFNEKSSEERVHSPKIAEPNQLAAMRILSRITLAAHLAAPDIMPLFVSKQVSLSIQYSNVPVSPFVYALYGFILCRTVGDIESGYKFGQLALKQLSQPNTQPLKAKTLLSVNIFIAHWKKHSRETLQPFIEGYHSGLETGDLEFAAYCAEVYCLLCLWVGKELVELEREMSMYGEAIRQLKQEAALTWTQMHHQVVLNLMGRSANPICLNGEAYNRENRLRQHETENNGTSIFFLYCYQLFLCYLFSEYSQAVENSSLVASYVRYVESTPPVSVYYFYSSLAQLATYFTSSDQAQVKILEAVAVNQNKLQVWADRAPMNHLHKYQLVQAETARVLGQLFEAEEFYEQAIQGARENRYIQEEALAYELAAKHYLARGREKFAQTYMKEAHYCYERWGATAKVRDLETRYPQFFSQSSNKASQTIPKISKTTSNSSPIAFDLAAVLKASQAISSEIELDRLLNYLMKILIENAGAQTGFLILENSGEWAIEAACVLNNDENVCATRVLQSIPIDNCLPESIINYVLRTHESVILNDATREGNFINEPYIQHNQTQSIFCLPLLNQGKLVGVLYLENQLATGAFTPERSQVLHLLSTQAAIAIENAKLYSKLRASESQMAQFLEAVPIGIGVVDTLGRPCYANQQAIQLLGKGIIPGATPEQLAEIYQLYLAGTEQPYPIENLPVMRALSGDRTRIDDLEIRQNNAIIPVEGWGTPVFDEQGNVIYAISAFQDITERKQAEQLLADYNRTLEQQVAQRTAALQKSEAELRAREQELRLITDALPACICYVDTDRRYRFANRTYEEWYGCSRDEILGKQVREVISEAAYQIIEPYINRALAGQIITYEAEVPLPLGKKYIAVTSIPDFDLNAQVRGYYGLITDISEQRNAALRERKRAEDALILEERNRMAREIHDTLAQAFTSIIVHLDAASQRLKLDPDAAQSHLKTGRVLARSGLADARRSVEALRPQILEEGDLYSALERFMTQMFYLTPVRVVCTTIGEPYALPNEVEVNLLRIGQEALTNAFKYANASKICVELRYERSQFVLQIEDNGQGFESSSLSIGRGFGLLGMTERAQRIGAELTIVSHLGQGTEIVVRVQTP
ncbi:MAG: AAA family ATPase [Nostoc sp.]|uniref:AAA family ATPase n=1 Tax=Nostoc sp. TaxID=1180 RepID=UPI002FF32257